MKSFVKDLAGGLLIILAALFLGLIHNALRSNKIPLIPKLASAKVAFSNSVEQDSVPGDKKPDTSATKIDSTLEQDSSKEILGIIPIEKAKALFDANAAIFMDARSEKAYSEGHIAGAMNVPYDKLVDYYDILTTTVRNDALIVCYCWSPTCDFSDNLASELVLMGYENVVVFKGGWEEWEKAGYPSEGSKVGK